MCDSCSSKSSARNQSSKPNLDSSAVLLYYKYKNIDDVAEVVQEQLQLCKKLDLTGRIRISKEGINGTLAGLRAKLNIYTAETSKTFENVDWKFSPLSENETAFDGLHVKAVSCIVGNSTNVTYSFEGTGMHLSPEDFHKKAQQDDTILIDVRNSYEFAIGHFENAVNPSTRCFSRFSKWIKDAKRQGLFESKQSVLMYCTGGIRCEKASIEMKEELQHDDINVYQLQGGIHRYLEKYGSKGKFKGKNFVFDKRIIQPHDDGAAVVGECSICSTPYDTIHDDRRCKKCRLLVLICDECETTRKKEYWCHDHTYLDPNVCRENPEKLKEIGSMIAKNEEKLKNDELRGRRNRNKRLMIQKTISELKEVLDSCQ